MPRPQVASSMHPVVLPDVSRYYKNIPLLKFSNTILALHIKLGDNEEVPVDLNYVQETRLQVGVRKFLAGVTKPDYCEAQ